MLHCPPLWRHRLASACFLIAVCLTGRGVEAEDFSITQGSNEDGPTVGFSVIGGLEADTWRVRFDNYVMGPQGPEWVNPPPDYGGELNKTYVDNQPPPGGPGGQRFVGHAKQFQAATTGYFMVVFEKQGTGGGWIEAHRTLFYISP